jgi:hypothetical protein
MTVHFCQAVIATIKELPIEVLPYLPYIPDIASNDCHFLGPLKATFSGIHFLYF